MYTKLALGTKGQALEKTSRTQPPDAEPLEVSMPLWGSEVLPIFRPNYETGL